MKKQIVLEQKDIEVAIRRFIWEQYDIKLENIKYINLQVNLGQGTVSCVAEVEG